MFDSVPSISSTFFQELLQYEIPHSTMIPNIPKYNGTTYKHINTYEWTMKSLQMDKRFTCTCTYFPVTLSGNASKWFKAL